MHLNDDNASSDLDEDPEDRYLALNILTSKSEPYGSPRENQCIDLSLDNFLIKFRLEEDYWKVINDGPWFIGQQFPSV
ncbi:hypothetical protein CFP56_019769 [Quercus suber]|uniref:DUF4283 domain-containing protein n=1 Tax=Quercus suber TaxID=58331 RepID=A0AAW0M2Y6_QUESU